MLRHLPLLLALSLAACGTRKTESVTLPGIPVEPPGASQTPASRDQTDTSHSTPPPQHQQPAEATRVVEVTRSGITITAVTFDSRTHHLSIADQAGGPGSRWPDAAAAGRELGGIAAVNAGFFTPEGKPLGLVVTGGKRVSPVNNSSSLGAGLFIGGPSLTLQRRGHSTSAPEILQSGPFLVENGHVISGLSQDSSTARSVLGWDGGSRWFIARTGACSLASLGQGLAGAEIGGVKVRTVLNLDGGRSSDLWVASSVPGGPVSQRPFWNKPVRNFLVLVPRR
ncbi:phosphodiester glycosidase family protein [Luteolibacter soli]|uniref:Phosphodiester glycosidase family protein n=1 Tax=Luteolibacter soli TaxID=3135280 RepID=A0ABU9AXU6_9BACT